MIAVTVVTALAIGARVRKYVEKKKRKRAAKRLLEEQAAAEAVLSADGDDKISFDLVDEKKKLASLEAQLEDAVDVEKKDNKDQKKVLGETKNETTTMTKITSTLGKITGSKQKDPTISNKENSTTATT